MKVKTIEVNSLVLAYLGDTVYEGYVRRYLIDKGICNVNDLQKESIKYVSAVNQAEFLKQMISESFLSTEEVDIVIRARNYKTTSHPKSCDIITYKEATSFEALFGYLKLQENTERIEEIISKIFTD